jgi:DNA-binding NtrC family response regulator
VRELENTVQRMLIHSRGDVIQEDSIHKALSQNLYDENTGNPVGGETAADGYGLEHIMMHYERKFIEDALKRWKNTRKAAAHLGISQSQLMRKKQKYNIESYKP